MNCWCHFLSTTTTRQTNYLTGAIQVDAVDCQVIALVILDFFVKFLVDRVRVEDEFWEVGRVGQVAHRRNVIHQKSIVEREWLLGRDLLAEDGHRWRPALHPLIGQHLTTARVDHISISHKHLGFL